MQATTVMYNTTRYTVEPVASAEVMLAMRKAILSAQARLDPLVVEVMIWDLLPGLLILAATSALVIEVGHAVITYRLQVATHIHTTQTQSPPDTCVFFIQAKTWSDPL